MSIGTFDDEDIEIVQALMYRSDLLRVANDLCGEHLVNLIVEQVLLVLPKLEELLDGAVFLLDSLDFRDRQIVTCLP